MLASPSEITTYKLGIEWKKRRKLKIIKKKKIEYRSQRKEKDDMLTLEHYKLQYL